MIDDNLIINHMLTTIGEGGVSTLNTLHPSVMTAKGILENEDVAFQSRGWWFNTERHFVLVVNEAGQVEVPAAALSVSVTNVGDKSSTEKLRYTRRGKFIYDTFLHTNAINKSVTVDLVIRLPISDLPPVAANYLKALAAERMYVADDGDDAKTRLLRDYRTEAWQMLKAQELTTLGANALDNHNAQMLRAVGGHGSATSIYGGGQR